MLRRQFLRGAAGALGATCMARAAMSQSGGDRFDPAEFERRRREARARALEAFPFKVVETPSGSAFAEWRARRSDKIAPVLIGEPGNLDRIIRPFDPKHTDPVAGSKTVEEVLERAARLDFPEGLKAKREARLEAFRKELATDPAYKKIYDQLTVQMRAAGIEVVGDDFQPPMGEWPKQPDRATTYSPPIDPETREPVPNVAMVLVPTEDWTTVPAHLRWGNWNSNPAAEHHVAALRSWRDRFGAELVSYEFDVVELRVSRRPASRDEALALAREHYVYCNDIIDQGFGGLAPLAASLMASNYWYFWWD